MKAHHKKRYIVALRYEGEEENRFEAIIDFIRQIVDHDNPAAALTECSEQIKKVIPLASSNKHLNHRIIGKLGATASLKYRRAA